jgi:pimeloyl-ACP methyl ester carboxylesterase
MPHLHVNGANLYYEDTGGKVGPVVLAHGLLWNCRMYDRQVAALWDRYRCVAFDFRGQGMSEVTETGYDLDTQVEDAAAIIRALDAAPCHFVGLSMGGMIGMRLATRHPTLLRSLVLLNTSAAPEPEENLPRYRLLNFVARWIGLGLVVGKVMPIMFGRTFLEDPARAELRAEWRKRLVSNHRVGITRAVKGVIERASVEDEVRAIRCPTLILTSDEDAATSPEKSKQLHALIPGSRLVVIPRAGHTSTVEAPDAVNRALREFLDAQRASNGAVTARASRVG